MLFKPKEMLQIMASLASEPRASRASGPLGSLGSRLAQLASLKSLARLGSSWPAREALRAGSALCQPWPEELRSSHISLKEEEKELKGGAKAYLYFIREHTGDPDEHATPRGNSDENSDSSVNAEVHSEGCHVVNSGVANV